MNLTSLTDVDFKSEEAMREFLDANALAHETIFNTILATGVVMEHYPLWTMGGADQDWLLVHDSEHRAIANALSLGLPPDLAEVDFQDERAAQDWFNNHALQHDLINQTLGL